MKKIADLIVKGRYILLIAAVVISIICAGLSMKVNVNTDLTVYLPDDFSMKQGLDIMNSEFPALDQGQTIRVMAEGLDEAEKSQLLSELKSIEYVSGVTYNSSDEYNKGDKTLYIVNTAFAY